MTNDQPTTRRASRSAGATTTPTAGPGAGVPWMTAVAAERRRRIRTSVLAHHRGSGPAEGSDTRFAVVIITCNRRTELLRTLDQLAAVPEHPRVIVADNASTDGTARAVRTAHPWVDVMVLDRNAGAAGRNIAVDAAEEDYIAFADDDTWWAPGSLARAADALDAHPAVASVTATIIVEPAGVEDPVVEDMRTSALPDDPALPGHPLLSILAGASMVRRSAFRQVGGFEPRFHIGGEEELLSADLVSAGWALRHLPEITVHHHASRARDPHRRRASGLRNTLWFAWLRRPWPDALRRSWRTVRSAPSDAVTLRGCVEAAAGLPWVLRWRRRVPAAVAADLRLLDDQQLGSPARRYVS